MISRIIHQTYRTWHDIPPAVKFTIERLRELNPEFDYRFYDDAAIESFIKRHYGQEILIQYRRIDPHYGAARADLFRYLCLYQFGGVYLDIKASMSRSLREVLQDDDHYLLSQWDQSLFSGWGSAKELAHIPGGEYQQWHVIAAPRHPFLKAVIESVLAKIASYDPFKQDSGPSAVLRLTGPVAYTLAIYPLLGTARYRFVDIERDLGIGYTLFSSSSAHYGLFNNHYTQQTRPVVKVSAWRSVLFRMYRIVRGVLRRFGLWR